jgi:hypothetical protein
MVTGNSDNQKRLQRKKIYVKEKGICVVNYFAGVQMKIEKDSREKAVISRKLWLFFLPDQFYFLLRSLL